MKKVDYKHHYDIFYPLLKSKQIVKNYLYFRIFFSQKLVSQNIKTLTKQSL